MTTFTAVDTFEIEHCYKCGMAFAMTTEFQRRRRNDHKMFYCPSGHPQHYTGMSDSDRAQKLAGQLDIERSRLESERRMRASVERQLDYQKRARKSVSTRLQKVKVRVGHGVCPCCNRTFRSLADHMATKHPTYAAAKDEA